jgi:branched-chain amino acid transport system permease protein
VVLRALDIDQMRPMLYGAILIVSILFLPKGLESLGPKIKAWLAGRKGKRTAERPSEAELPAE